MYQYDHDVTILLFIAAAPLFLPPNMPPRDRNPFEHSGFRDSVDGYYRDGDVQVSVLSSLHDDS